MKKKVSHKAKKQSVKRSTQTVSIFRINLYTTGLVFSIVLFAFTMWSKQFAYTTTNTVLGAHTAPAVIVPTATPTPSPVVFRHTLSK